MARTKLTSTIIEAAIYGFEAQKKSIDAQITELRALMNDASRPSSTEEGRPKRKRRKLSPEAIERMREGQQRRWAKVRGESATKTPGKTSTPRRKLSAAGRKAISTAMKKRWAAKKAVAA